MLHKIATNRSNENNKERVINAWRKKTEKRYKIVYVTLCGVSTYLLHIYMYYLPLVTTVYIMKELWMLFQNVLLKFLCLRLPLHPSIK